MHKDKREKKIKGTVVMGKAAVMGLLERHGEDGHSAGPSLWSPVSATANGATRRRATALEPTPLEHPITVAVFGRGSLLSIRWSAVNRQANATKQIVESRIGAKRIELWEYRQPTQSGGACLIRALQPFERAVIVVEPSED